MGVGSVQLFLKLTELEGILECDLESSIHIFWEPVSPSVVLEWWAGKLHSPISQHKAIPRGLPRDWGGGLHNWGMGWNYHHLYIKVVYLYQNMKHFQCVTHVFGYLLSNSNCRVQEISATSSLSDEENGPRGEVMLLGWKWCCLCDLLVISSPISQKERLKPSSQTCLGSPRIWWIRPRRGHQTIALLFQRVWPFYFPAY